MVRTSDTSNWNICRILVVLVLVASTADLSTALTFAGRDSLSIDLNAFSHFRLENNFGDAEEVFEKLREIYYPDFILSANHMESRLRADPATRDV